MFSKLSDSEKKVLRIWAIVGSIIFIGLVIIAIIDKVNPALIDISGEYSYKIVKDETRYYTVSNAISKYASYINAKDKESILTILDDDYKKNNNINDDNVLDIVGNFDKNISIMPSYMCSRKRNDKITQYIFNASINDTKGEQITTKNYSVYLDSENMIFSVEEVTSEYLGGNCK